MPDQEKRVEKVNIGADFTLRYCEYLPWLDLERGRVRYHPLCHSCGRIAAASDPGTRGTVSRPGARLTGNNFNNMSPIVTSVTRTLATMESTQGGLKYSTVQYSTEYSTVHVTDSHLNHPHPLVQGGLQYLQTTLSVCYYCLNVSLIVSKS